MSAMTPEERAVADREGERFSYIGRLIEAGSWGDLTPEALRWYVGRANELQWALGRLDRQDNAQIQAIRVLLPAKDR